MATTTFYNQANMSYRGINVLSNRVQGQIVGELSITKDTAATTYSTGDVVTYIVSISNTGASAYTGLTVTDDLGAYTFGSTTRVPLSYVPGSVMYYVNGVLQTAPTVTGGTNISISPISVPAGGNAMLIYSARVNEYAPLGAEGRVTNTAAVSGGTTISAVSDTATISADTSSKLTITKAVSPTPVAENGTLTYTFTIQNFGSNAATAADNIIVTDAFDPPLSNLAVTFNGTPWTAPANYTYASGAFATVAGQITVPGATFTQDTETGVWSTNPGTSVLIVSGTV